MPTTLGNMDLFSTETDTNLLPYNGEVYYYGHVLSQTQADHYFERLLNGIEWKNDAAQMYGKLIHTKRKVGWYGDKDYLYTYSGTTKQALPWTPELLELKEIAEKHSGTRFNSCLLNLYHDGSEGMAWHSDNEASLGKNTVIASISLGAERIFSFKHKKSKEIVSVLLQHGSLLIMQGTTQTYWHHCLPPNSKILRPRVNLTFRTIVEEF
eukprot:gene11657-14833_t